MEGRNLDKSSFECPESMLSERNLHVRGILYKNYHIPPHHHEFYELNIILGGEGIHKIDEVSVPVKKGDVFLIPPYTVHAYCDTESLDVYHIIFTKKFIDENKEEAISIPGFLQLIEIEPYLRKHISDSCFLHLSSTELSKIKPDILSIEDDGELDKEYLLPLKYHITWKILYYLSFLLDKQLNQSEKSEKTRENEILFKLMEYIHLNYYEKITVEHLCKIALLSRSSLFRVFMNVYKCTPMEYVNRYRCEKAMEMIEKGEVSKTHIAHNCGFYDLSHMERTMKKFY